MNAGPRKREAALFWLPVVSALFVALLSGPFFLVQVLPESVTQKAWFVAGVSDEGEKEEDVITYSIAGGIFRQAPPSGSSVLWSASLFAHRWYFEPTARVLRKIGWGREYRYL
jgi:hypothetical protein